MRITNQNRKCWFLWQLDMEIETVTYKLAIWVTITAYGHCVNINAFLQFLVLLDYKKKWVEDYLLFIIENCLLDIWCFNNILLYDDVIILKWRFYITCKFVALGIKWILIFKNIIYPLFILLVLYYLRCIRFVNNLYFVIFFFKSSTSI